MTTGTPDISVLDRLTLEQGNPHRGESANPSSPSASGHADEFVKRLTSTHYENFPVLSWLVPADLREDFAAVYAYCRCCDDLGDETGNDDAARQLSLELLARWRVMLEHCFAFASGTSQTPPTHPVFTALAKTIRKHTLTAAPFHHLIDAFEQDQRVMRYETWSQLLDYCTRSADPVGRIILELVGHKPGSPGFDQLARMSDATCTALQLTNFWQDVRRDLEERDRVYLPTADTGITADELRAWLNRSDDPEVRIRYIRAVRPLVQKTRELFDTGRPLPQHLGTKMGRVVWLFGAGGESVLNSVERIGCTTLWERPKLSKLRKLTLLCTASLMRFSRTPAPRPFPAGGAS